MNRNRFASVVLGIIWMSSACQPGADLKDNAHISGSGTTEKAGTPASPKPSTGVTQEPQSNEEKIDPPQNIIGHYLHCSYESAPTDAVPEALIGCRFDNAEGQRVPASTLGSSYKYSSEVTANSGLTVYSRALTDDNRYDVIFLFMGTTPKQITAGILRSTIKVEIKQSVATGKDVLVGSKFVDTERDVSTLPEPRTTDYTIVREAILVDAQKDSQPPPP